MTEETWINRCAYRLVSLHGYGLQDAYEMAESLAQQQAQQYGEDAGKWVAAFAVADECEGGDEA